MNKVPQSSKDTDPDNAFEQLMLRVARGDNEATTDLWEQTGPRLLRYCRGKMPAHLRRMLDEEDVAMSAFKSLCIRARDGSLGDIGDGDVFWKLLYCIAARKAAGYIRHQTCEKRGGGRVGGDSIFLRGERGDADGGGIEMVADAQTSTAMLAEFAHDCEVLMEQLGDERLQMIAALRLEGYSVDEIAQRVGCAKRSVERRLNLIRQIWQRSLD